MNNKTIKSNYSFLPFYKYNNKTKTTKKCYINKKEVSLASPFFIWKHFISNDICKSKYQVTFKDS